jgi:hypothetical protein
MTLFGSNGDNSGASKILEFSHLQEINSFDKSF